MLSDLRKMKERNMLFDHYREKFIDIYMNDSAKDMIVSRLLSSRAILYELMAYHLLWKLVHPARHSR